MSGSLRAYPRLTNFDLRSVQKALNDTWDYLYQLAEAKTGIQLSQASVDVTLTNTPIPIPGAALNLDAGEYLVIGVFDIGFNVTANQVFGYLNVDGVQAVTYAESLLLTGTGTNSLVATMTQAWKVTSKSPVRVNLSASKVTGGGTAQVRKIGTQIIAIKS